MQIKYLIPIYLWGAQNFIMLIFFHYVLRFGNHYKTNLLPKDTQTCFSFNFYLHHNTLKAKSEYKHIK